MKINESHSLLPHNTFGIAATAVYFIEVESEEDAVALSRDEYFRTLPFLAIGGGSNLLFRGDFKGAILHYTSEVVSTLRENETGKVIHVEGGKNWHELVMEVTRDGLWGIENLALIPGETGAAAVQNIGAYGREICDAVEAIHYVDLRDGSKHQLSRDEAHYQYRHSVFKEEEMAHAFVTGVDLVLRKDFSPMLEYRGLHHLEERGSRLTPTDVASEVIRIREEKLPDPKVFPNAGSFFMNPLLTRETFHSLEALYPDIPHFDVDEGRVKVPAAWMIQECGLKGKRVGNVGTFPSQPLCIVNYGGASGKEISDFSEMIRKAVRQKFGVEITPEVRFIRSAALHSINELPLD